MIEFSKDYEKHGGTFAVSYATYSEYDNLQYRDHARQQAKHELCCKLYEMLMHTRNPAVVKLNEHDTKTDYPTPQTTTTLTVTVTPVETQHIVMPSYYEPSYHYAQPSVRTAVRYWLGNVYQKLQRNWKQK